MKILFLLLFLSLEYIAFAQVDSLDFQPTRKKRETLYLPVYRYIHSGMHFGGFHISNKYKKFESSFNYLIEPVFGNKNIYGRFGIANKFKIGNGLIKVIEPQLYLKHYPYFKNKQFDYTTSFTKIKGTVLLRLNSTNTCNEYFGLSHNYIDETNVIFANSSIFDFISTDLHSSRLYYTKVKCDSIHPISTFILFERTQYEDLRLQNKVFTKISVKRKQAWKYKENKFINMELWAGYFLSNPERKTNTYANDLVKGSFTLSSQGFNDYLYDELFISRKSVGTSFFNNQVSRLDGGMRFGGTSTSHIGLSNDYAFSVLTSVDLIAKQDVFTLSPFFDIGGSRADGKVNYLYFGGLSLNLLKHLKVNIPLLMNKSLYDFYKFSNIGFLERISFSINTPHNYFD